MEENHQKDPREIKDKKPANGFAAIINNWRKWFKKWRAYFRMGSRFNPILRKQTKRLVLAFVFAVGYTLVGILEPWPIKLIFDNVLLLHKHPLPSYLSPILAPYADNPLFLLNLFIGGIILIAMARGLAYYYQQLLTAKSGQLIAADIRVDLYTHLQYLCFSFHDRRRTGDLLMRLTSDIRVLRDILISLPLLVMGEFFLVIGMVAIMVTMDWQLTLLSLTIIPILAILLRIYQKPMKHAARRQREREGRLATIASEVLGAMKVVQSFQRERYEIDRFRLHNKDSLRSGLRSTKLEAKMRWTTGLSVAIVTALVLGLAVRRVLSGMLSPGDVLVFFAYLQAFTRPLRRISSMTERLARGTAAGERLLEMLRTQPKVYDRTSAVQAEGLRGEVAYEKVSFAYQKNSPVLFDIRLNIKQGERVAFIGPTGSGKSTLASLLPRFYDPTQGKVLIDGRDVREFTLASLRQHISLVFQEPVLFAATIAENIAYGKPDATEEEITNAAALAGIDPIIAALPEGYNTVIGERGCTLSGGQRQCVAIARAMIKNAPMVILDEPTSGLDSQSSDLVMKALQRLMEDRTVIMITHQLNIMREANRLIVIEGGRIVDEGSPSDLLDRKSHDRLFQRQLSEQLIS
jgi:ABC-type multidrug transport system fused ATPase/permease subunit